MGSFTWTKIIGKSMSPLVIRFVSRGQCIKWNHIPCLFIVVRFDSFHRRSPQWQPIILPMLRRYDHRETKSELWCLALLFYNGFSFQHVCIKFKPAREISVYILPRRSGLRKESLRSRSPRRWKSGLNVWTRKKNLWSSLRKPRNRIPYVCVFD